MPPRPNIPNHVYANNWEQQSQQEFQWVRDQNSFDAQTLLFALSQGEYTDVRVRFPVDGELTITIPREAVEQLYQNFPVRFRIPAVSLLRQALRHVLGIIERPQFSEQKMDPFPTAPPFPGDPDYESYWEAYRRDWPDILPPKEEEG